MGNSISENYKKGWEALILPEKHDYSMDMLGPKFSMVNMTQITREDFEITNKENFKLFGSIFLPEGAQPGLPCVLYLHTRGGCRPEGLF